MFIQSHREICFFGEAFLRDVNGEQFPIIILRKNTSVFESGLAPQCAHHSDNFISL